MPSQNINSKSSGVKSALRKFFSPWRSKKDKKKTKLENDSLKKSEPGDSPLHQDAGSSLSPTPCTSSPSQGSMDRHEFGSRSMPHKSFMFELESKLSTHPSRESCSSFRDVKSMESWGSALTSDSPVCVSKSPKTSELAGSEYYRSTNLMSEATNHKLAVSRQRNRRPPSAHPLRPSQPQLRPNSPESEHSDFFPTLPSSNGSPMADHKPLDLINEETESQSLVQQPSRHLSGTLDHTDPERHPTPVTKIRSLSQNSASSSSVPTKSSRPTSVCSNEPESNPADLVSQTPKPKIRSHSTFVPEKSNGRSESLHTNHELPSPKSTPSPPPVKSRTSITVAVSRPVPSSWILQPDTDQVISTGQPKLEDQSHSAVPARRAVVNLRIPNSQIDKTESAESNPSTKLDSSNGFQNLETSEIDSKPKYARNRNSAESKFIRDSANGLYKATARPCSQGDMISPLNKSSESQSNQSSPEVIEDDTTVSVVLRAAAFGPVMKNIRKSESGHRLSCHIQPESVVVRRPRLDSQPSPPAEYRRSCVMDLVKTFQQMD